MLRRGVLNTLHNCNSSLPNSLNSVGWTVGWGFTTRCDLRCPFCYSSEVRHSLQLPELDITQAEQFLAKNGKSIHAINFGTGECLLSPTFPLLLELCNKYAPHAQVAVTTNGTFADLSSNVLSAVTQYISECDVSLDFAQPDEHDRWRGKKGIWQRAMTAIELAIEFGLSTSIVMIGTAQTLKEENIQGLLKISEAYQVALRINLYMPTFGDYSFIPSIESVFTTLSILKTWSSAVCSSDRLIGNIIGNHGSDLYTETKRSCRILPDGSISPSTYLIKAPWLIQSTLSNVVLTNILDTEPFIRYTSPPVPVDCEKCSMLPECKGGSIERRWLWAHSLERPDPLCPKLYHAKHNIVPLLPKGKVLEKWPGPTIHLDYLPTIIALPLSSLKS